MKWHKRLKYSICCGICKACEWVRQMVVDEPTYEELEERIFDLECMIENLKDDVGHYQRIMGERTDVWNPYE